MLKLSESAGFNEISSNVAIKYCDEPINPCKHFLNHFPRKNENSRKLWTIFRITMFLKNTGKDNLQSLI